MNKADLVERVAELAKVLSSNDGNDFLFATSGTDELTGTPKNDIFNSGVGVDSLTNGLGYNIFTGGNETDTLVFTKGNESLLDNFDRTTNAVNHLNVQDLPVELVELSDEALSQIWGGVRKVRNDADLNCTRWWVHFSPGAGDYPCEEVLFERKPFLRG
jgi:hypothetical protein